MRIRAFVTEQEQKILAGISCAANVKPMAKRHSRIILMSSKGKYSKDIAAEIGCHVDTVRQAINTWNKNKGVNEITRKLEALISKGKNSNRDCEKSVIKTLKSKRLRDLSIKELEVCILVETESEQITALKEAIFSKKMSSTKAKRYIGNLVMSLLGKERIEGRFNVQSIEEEKQFRRLDLTYLKALHENEEDLNRKQELKVTINTLRHLKQKEHPKIRELVYQVINALPMQTSPQLRYEILFETERCIYEEANKIDMELWRFRRRQTKNPVLDRELSPNSCWALSRLLQRRGQSTRVINACLVNES